MFYIYLFVVVVVVVVSHHWVSSLLFPCICSLFVDGTLVTIMSIQIQFVGVISRFTLSLSRSIRLIRQNTHRSHGTPSVLCKHNGREKNHIQLFRINADRLIIGKILYSILYFRCGIVTSSVVLCASRNHGFVVERTNIGIVLVGHRRYCFSYNQTMERQWAGARWLQKMIHNVWANTTTKQKKKNVCYHEDHIVIAH